MDCGDPEDFRTTTDGDILTIQEAPISFFKKGKPYCVSNLESGKVSFIKQTIS